MCVCKTPTQCIRTSTLISFDTVQEGLQGRQGAHTLQLKYLFRMLLFFQRREKKGGRSQVNQIKMKNTFRRTKKAWTREPGHTHTHPHTQEHIQTHTSAHMHRCSYIPACLALSDPKESTGGELSEEEVKRKREIKSF